MQHNHLKKGSFRDRLRYLRETKGLTQGDLALIISQKTGEICARTSVSKWENGKHDPSPLYLETLAEIFGVSIDYLTGAKSSITQISLPNAIADRPMLKKLVLHLLQEDDEKIWALCTLVGIK